MEIKKINQMHKSKNILKIALCIVILMSSFGATTFAESTPLTGLERWYVPVDLKSNRFSEFLASISESAENRVVDAAEDIMSLVTHDIDKNNMIGEFSNSRSSRFSLQRKNDDEWIFGFYIKQNGSDRDPRKFSARSGSIPFFIHEENDHEKYNDLINMVESGYDLCVLSMAAINLEVLELKGSFLSHDCFAYLSKFETVKKLGLPSNFVEFGDDLHFPPNLDTLIVRNAVLNEQFFKATNRLKDLRHLVLIECSTTLPETVLLDFDLIDKIRTRDSAGRPFKTLAERLSTLTVLRCDTRIVGHLISEKWNSLKEFRIEIRDELAIFLSVSLQTSAHEGDFDTFPMVEKGMIGVSPISFRDLEMITKKLSEREDSLRSDHERYLIYEIE